ncbi:MAG: hypothetical protein ACRD1G_08060, partial [Acidimicrobiales bacterium]
MTPWIIADAAPANLWNNLGATSIAFTPSILIGGAAVLYVFGAWRVDRLHADSPWSPRRTAAFLSA